MSTKKRWIVIVLVLLALYTATAASIDECLVRELSGASCPAGETALFSISNETNAHVSTDPSEYDHTVCCKGTDIGVSLNSSFVTELMFRMHNLTNSHVEGYEAPGNYPYEFSLISTDPTYTAFCNFRPEFCIEEETCVIQASDYTNAHVTDCKNYIDPVQTYPARVCCKYELTQYDFDINASVDIWNIGETGFNTTAPECTALRTVLLKLDYTFDPKLKDCRYGNLPDDGNYSNINWSKWTTCSSTKEWSLSEGDGNKTVFFQARDINFNIDTDNDTIVLDHTGACLDTTPPSAPTVYDEGRWTGDNTSLFAWWEGAYDRETELLHLNLTYEYRIMGNGTILVKNWTSTGTNTSVNSTGLSLAEDINYTFDVRAINTVGMTATNSSDGIELDITKPTVSVSSPTHPNQALNYSIIDVNITWNGTDTKSGIYGYFIYFGLNDSVIPTEFVNSSVLERRYENLLDGKYYFRIIPIDNVGNLGDLVQFNVTIVTQPPNGWIKIWNIGETGFNTTEPECTASQTVTLELNFTDDVQVQDCRYSNDNATWTPWEICLVTREWRLTSGDGNKTVYYQIRDTSNNTAIVNDTIVLDHTGACLDTTPPIPPIVIDEGRWVGHDDYLYAYWVNASDRETEMLHLDLVYQYQITDNLSNIIVNWTSTGTETEVNSTGLSLVEDRNYTFTVNVTNPAGYWSTATSDGIELDLTPPTAVVVESSTHPNESESYSNPNVNLNWSATDTKSGIEGYIYSLDNIPTTDPVNYYGPRNITNITYTGLSDGTYYFHVKAVDKTGNEGPVTHFKITIDTGIAGITLFQHVTPVNTNTINITGTSTENMSLEVFVNGINQVNGTSNGTFNIQITLTAGNNAIYVNGTDAASNVIQSNTINVVYDTAFAGIVSSGPTGTVKTIRPILNAETAEKATCEYKLSTDSIWREFTDTEETRYHETSVQAADGDAPTYDIRCTDEAGNIATTQISFDVSLDEISGISITTPGTVTAGQQFTFEVSIGSGEEQVQANEFILKIDDEVVDKTVRDIGNGDYNITATAPAEPDDGDFYKISISVHGFEDIEYFEVESDLLEMSCSGCSKISDHIVSKSGSGYTIGLATETEEPSIAGNTLRTNLAESPTYLFVTRPGAKVTDREKDFRRKAFSELPSPTIGYGSKEGVQTIATIIEYDDIIITGDVQNINPGTYNMLIKNRGKDPTTGKTIIEIEVI